MPAVPDNGPYPGESKTSPGAVLNLPLPPNDSGADTVRGYLIALLLAVWTEGEGFSGKCPFGNSGWEADILVALVRAGVIEGTLDSDGYLEVLSRDEERKGQEMIMHAIRALR